MNFVPQPPGRTPHGASPLSWLLVTHDKTPQRPPEKLRWPRVGALVLAAVFIVAGVASCRTQPDTAAYVGDDRIMVEDLDRQVSEIAKDPVWGADVRRNRDIATRYTLNALVLRDLLGDYATKLNIAVPAADMEARYKAYKEHPELMKPPFVGIPIRLAAQVDTYVDVIGRREIDVKQPPDVQLSQWRQLIRKLAKDSPVQINPRYGKFEPMDVLVIALDDPGVREVDR